MEVGVIKASKEKFFVIFCMEGPVEEKYIDMAVNNAVSPVTGLVLAFPSFVWYWSESTNWSAVCCETLAG